MLATLMQPKNAVKGEWIDLSWAELDKLLQEEHEEVRREIKAIRKGDTAALARLMTETSDLSITSLFLNEKAYNEIIKRASKE